jgi:hypothetical protein
MASHLACGANVLAPDLELSVDQPKLGERERLVGNSGKRSLVDLASARKVLSDQLFKHAVVDPKINVPGSEKNDS